MKEVKLNMVEKKLFGYPTFDENGEEILSTYDNEYRDMLMDVRLYRMAAGSTREFCREGEEIAVLLLSGEITFKWAEGEKTVSNAHCTGPGRYPSCLRRTGRNPKGI